MEEDPDTALAEATEALRLVEGGAGSGALYSAQTVALILLSRRDLAGAARAIRIAISQLAEAGYRLAVAVVVVIAVLVLAADSASWDAAAILAGAVHGPVLGHLWPFVAGDVDGYETGVVELAAALGAVVHGRALGRGAEMTFDEIVGFALDALERLAAGH
jgi:hypothetical protein